MVKFRSGVSPVGWWICSPRNWLGFNSWCQISYSRRGWFAFDRIGEGICEGCVSRLRLSLPSNQKKETVGKVFVSFFLYSFLSELQTLKRKACLFSVLMWLSVTVAQKKVRTIFKHCRNKRQKPRWFCLFSNKFHFLLPPTITKPPPPPVTLPASTGNHSSHSFTCSDFTRSSWAYKPNKSFVSVFNRKMKTWFLLFYVNRKPKTVNVTTQQYEKTYHRGWSWHWKSPRPCKRLSHFQTCLHPTKAWRIFPSSFPVLRFCRLRRLKYSSVFPSYPLKQTDVTRKIKKRKH